MRTLIAGLVIALVILVGVALYFGWMDVSTSRNSSAGTSELKIKIDESKAKEDLRTAGQEIRETARNVGANVREGVERLKGEQTVKGKVESVDATQNTVTIRPETGSATTVHLTDATKIRIGDKAGKRDDLKPGETATCTHIEKDGKRVCTSLTVELNK